MINVIENYASALFEIYLENSNMTFFSNLKTLKAIFKKNNDLIKLLGSLMISKFERNDIIDVIFRNKIEKTLLDFMHILVENNSFLHIVPIVGSTLSKISDEQGINFVKVETPFELDDYQIEKIRFIIQKRKNGVSDIEVVINKSLIGGIKISFGSDVIDGSIKYRLQQIKKNVINS